MNKETMHSHRPGIFAVLRCDNCGKINPPPLAGNHRLCGACAKPDGFYSMPGTNLRANGKVNWWTFQFPIEIKWRGWLKL